MILLPVVWSYLEMCKSHVLCLFFFFLIDLPWSVVDFLKSFMMIVFIHNFLSNVLLNFVDELEFKITFMFLFLDCHLSSTTAFWDPIFSSTSNLTHSVDMYQNIYIYIFYAYFPLEVSCNSSNTRYKYSLSHMYLLSLHFTHTREKYSQLWQAIQQLVKTMID